LFEIQEVQLQAAGGHARCSCCDNIFNAKKHLIQKEPTAKPPRDELSPQKDSGEISLNGLFEDIELDDTAFPEFHPETRQADVDDHPNHPAAGESPSEPKKPAANFEESAPDSKPVCLQDKPAFSAVMQKQEFDTTKVESDLSGPVAEMIGRSGKSNRGGYPVLWSIAILCLLTTSLAQIVWFSRDDLKRYPEVRELLERVCAQTGCNLSPWHEPERFNISSRSVRTHPKNNSALQIHLVFYNSARFAQAYPQMQLRLYDTKERLSAQRVFLPEEYLARPLPKTLLIGPDESVKVEMALSDPGAGITGFKIEFL